MLQKLQFKIHLILSVIIVIPAGIIYGFYPNLFLNCEHETIDESNVYKAIFGLYILFSLLWIKGILDSNYWKIATISNILFMLGLALGRLISLFEDGLPSSIFILGLMGETVLGIYGLYALKRNR